MKTITYRHRLWPRGAFIYFLPNLIFLGYLIFLFNPITGGGIGSYLLLALYLIYVVIALREIIKGNLVYELTNDGLVYPYFVGIVEKKCFTLHWCNINKVEAVAHGQTGPAHRPLYWVNVILNNMENIPKPIHGSKHLNDGLVSLWFPSMIPDLQKQIAEFNNFITQCCDWRVEQID